MNLGTRALVPCCPRCGLPLQEVSEDTPPYPSGDFPLGWCPQHAFVRSGDEVWR